MQTFKTLKMNIKMPIDATVTSSFYFKVSNFVPYEN